MAKKPLHSPSSIRKKVLPGLKRHEVKRAAVFGSFATEAATSRSDVDLLIEYQGNNKSLFDLVDLKPELEEILGLKVDLLTYRSIHSSLRERILAEQIVIL